MNETYYVKTEEKEHTVKIQNEEEKFYSYDGELVEDPTGTLVEKTITENGEYLPSDDDADGYSKVTVNTPIKTLIEKSITANGEYLPASDNADGYSKVTVNVSGAMKLGQLFNKTVTTITLVDLDGCTVIMDYAFKSCVSLSSVELPNSILRIGIQAFMNCSNLLSLVIPNSVTSIDAQAFSSSGIQDLVIPNSVLTLGNCCHSANVRTIDIGTGIQEIGAGFAYNCTYLSSVTIRATTPPTLINTNALPGSYPIYVPAASVDTYKGATNWASLASRIQAIPA